MNGARTGLLAIGAALFVGLLVWQGVGSVGTLVATAGWGLVVVALFHLVPLALDAVAIFVLLDPRTRGATLKNALLSRWSGEAVNGLLPGGQIGGPVLMVRYLAQRGLVNADAAAAITVSTTMQAIAQVAFIVVGVGAFAATAGAGGLDGLGLPVTIAAVILAAMVGGFWWTQRRGLFGRLLGAAARLFGRRDWSGMAAQAEAIDVAVTALYRQRARVAATFLWSLAGWIVGVGEVWLALRFLGHPVDWVDALLLESAGQAIRGAAFAIPGSLGAQEGGFLLLAPLVALPLEVALALSLVKRFRELALGLPGLVHLHLSERRWRRRNQGSDTLPLPAVD